jgi:hypothetical protein
MMERRSSGYHRDPAAYHRNLQRTPAPLSGADAKPPRSVRRDLGGRIASAGCEAASEELGRLGQRAAGMACEEIYDRLRQLGKDDEDE